MATQVQNRRGSTSEHSTFTGAVAEVTVDTDKDTVVVHDGTTAGGRPLLREDQSNLPTSAPTTGIYNNSGALALSTSGTGRLLIDSSGNVGIGTTSPSTKLELAGDAATQLSIDANTGSGLRGIVFKNSGTAICQITHNASSGEFNIKAGSSGNGSNFITFGTDQGTERARIDSSGRLLVGTSSARSGANTFEGTSFGSSSLVLATNQNNASPSYLQFYKSRGTSVGSTTIVTGNDVLGSIQFGGLDGSNPIAAADISAAVDGTPGANDMPGRLVFSTTADGASSPTERMRIGNGGITYIVSTSVGLAASTTAAAGTSVELFEGKYGGTAGAIASGTTSFRVWSNGNVQNTNNSYTAISDVKLKENIVDASSQWDDIKALRPVNYNFKAETGHETFTQLGLIAQEVELVSPGLVSESPDRDADGNDLGTVTKSVNYSVLYMKAVKALQEAMERIETLEAEVSALRSA